MAALHHSTLHGGGPAAETTLHVPADVAEELLVAADALGVGLEQALAWSIHTLRRSRVVRDAIVRHEIAAACGRHPSAADTAR